MKRLAGMLAALLVSAAQSQTPKSDLTPPVAQAPDTTPAAPPIAQPATPADVAVAPTSTAEATMPGDATPAPAPAQPVAPEATRTAPGATPQPTALGATPTAPSATPQLTAPGATPTGASATPEPSAAAVPRADLAQATTYLKSAIADFTTCRRPSACNAYFETFGIAISFADGSISPFLHIQRLMTTSRECVKKAKALEEEGNRSMAVQWAMAAKVENRTARDWLGNHPDAVLAALRQVTVL
jgi:hypothetical protein